ncbi:hypothetical protein SteCoe_19741 [Stentor coeruleus]|uniref:Clathrin adaptor alpha/beta/gamma-adaptin appendage Ig-like subdomain domain-containing protein n=1 Tax=Stentor coeruleus TaxID=5963 RepID=A0A1R2BTE7_9CILI|nr:hypothetical protein SteCoe_19741 [Stentor coeruleus]
MNSKPGDLVIQATNSDQTYSEVLPHIKNLVITADIEICKPVILEIKKIIKDRRIIPVKKVLALNLFQECMMLKNSDFLNFAQSKILVRLSILAQKKKEDLFRDSNNSQDNLLASQAFIHNLLIYIQIWALQYGIGTSGEPTAYFYMYSQLSNKVEFPQIFQETSKSIEKKYEPSQIYHQPKSKRSNTKFSRTDKETLEYLENLLAIIEEIVNPHEDETGKNLIGNMIQIKPKLEMLLNTAISNNDYFETKKLLSLNNRVQKIVDKKLQNREDRKIINKNLNLQLKNSERRGSSRVIEKKLKSATLQIHRETKFQSKNPLNEPSKEENPHPTQPKTSKNVFNKILDLDFKPTANPSYKSQSISYENPALFFSSGPEPSEFSSSASQPSNISNPPVIPMPKPPVSGTKPISYHNLSLNIPKLPLPLPNIIPPPNLDTSGTMPIIIPNSPLIEKTSLTKSSLSNIIPSPNIYPLSENDKIIADLKVELASLQKANNDKDEVIGNLNKIIFELRDKCNLLELVVVKTKEILAGKEKECQEYHVLKDQKTGFVGENCGFFGEISCPSKIMDFQQVIIPQETHADNDDIFRYICSESFTVVHDCELFQVGVQLLCEEDYVKMWFYLGNKSVGVLENIQVSIENPSTFDIAILSSVANEIQPNNQENFYVSCKLKSFSSVYPRMSVKMISGHKALSYSLKIPLSIGKFTSPISLTPFDIWKKWENMMFASENTVCKCTIACRYLPEILKFSDNMLILNTFDEKKISKGKSMVVAKINELVISMIYIKKTEGICEIETRANDSQLRKTFMMLLVSHVSD